jgi:serine/threonine-protein kinase
MSTAPDVFARGEVLAGTYEIGAKIGEGGMGQVYAAFDRALRRWVAIKAGRPRLGACVLDEARGLAVLRHPCAVAVYAVGVHRGVVYMVMERIEGPTLAQYLDRHRLPGSGLPIGDAIDILAGVADALAVVHAAGMAHRDVKPSNVLLGPHDRIVLTDFGLFQTELDAARGPRREGSPHYMAPETLFGRVGQGELHLVDVYALGIVAYEMIVGAVPFDDANAFRVASLHVQQPAPDPCIARPDCPPWLGSLVREMLAKDPCARPQRTEEVSWRLRRLRSPRGVSHRLEGLRPAWV